MTLTRFQSELVWHLQNDVSPPTHEAALARWTRSRVVDVQWALAQLAKLGLVKRAGTSTWKALHPCSGPCAANVPGTTPDWKQCETCGGNGYVERTR